MLHEPVLVTPLVGDGDVDAPLSTYATVDGDGFSHVLAQEKRSHDRVDAVLLCQDTLEYAIDRDPPASLHGVPVDLACVREWHVRMCPGTLMHPAHATLLDVFVKHHGGQEIQRGGSTSDSKRKGIEWDETSPILTVPLLQGTSSWLLTCLALPIVHVDTRLSWSERRLVLRMDVLLSHACFAPHSPSTADQLRTIVEHANQLAGTFSLSHAHAIDELSGATLVYESLCRRERERSTQMPPAEQPRALLATLLPFQRRSVSFLLEREAPPSERRTLRTECGPWWIHAGNKAGLYFNVLTGEFTVDATAAVGVAGDVRGAILAEEMGLGKTIEVLALILEQADPHRHEKHEAYWDVQNEVCVQPIGTTLIVSPETLRRQWLDEVATYAPSLRLYSYTGHKQASEHRGRTETWGQWASQYDVMVVSFEVLARDLAASHAAPVRALRHPPRYERPRSPLVQLEFLRVVMDEVQLVGGNAAKTIGMIRRQHSLAVSGTPVRRLADLRTSLWFLGLVPPSMTTPRAWKRILSAELAPYVCELLANVGIRHTKAQVAHEMVLPPQTRFLVPVDFTHVETAFYRDVWQASLAALNLDADGAPMSDTWVLDTGVLRSQLLRLRQACTHPQVAMRGGHVLGAADLSNACGGSVSAGALGSVEAAGTSNVASGAINLRSIEHVLAQMIEASRLDLNTLKHALISRRIYRASILLFAPADELACDHLFSSSGKGSAEADEKKDIHSHDRFVAADATTMAPSPVTAATTALMEDVRTRDRRNVARDQLETLLAEAQAHVDALNEAIREAHVRGPWYVLTETEQEQLAAYAQAADPSGPALPDAPIHEKLRLRQQYVGALKSRQRHWLQVLHRIQQFSGHCYFQLGQSITSECGGEPAGEHLDNGLSNVNTGPSPSPYSALEDTAYQAAELTRQQLLADARMHVEQCASALQKQVVDVDQLAQVKMPSMTGLTGRAILDDVAERVHMLQAHAELILDWRAQIYARLMKPVNREVNKAREDDDVYAENLDAQIEAETLLEMYRPLLAQRDELLTGRIALGATARPQLFVKLDRELRSARLRRFQVEHVDEGTGDAYDTDGKGKGDKDEFSEQVRQTKRLQLNHFRTLEEARRCVMLPPNAPPLSALLSAIRDVRDSSLHHEAQLLASMHAAVQTLLREQQRHLDALRREQMLCQALFNARAMYFKQVQELSDQVQDPVMPNGPWASISTSLAQERTLRQKIGATEGRLRYLGHVQLMQEASTKYRHRSGSTRGTGTDDADTDIDADEARRCFICTNLIETGILTNACGHLCCEACFHAWLSHGHRTCPMCKTRLAPRDVHRVVYRTATTWTGPSASSAYTSSNTFQVLPAEMRQALDNMALEGGSGSKLDLLIRHLVHIQCTTGEKSLVFSSFARGLDLVASNLERHGLAYARVDGTGGKRSSAAVHAFQHKPDVRVLLLHSEAQSAGLNLLAATHMFLLEPLLNHAMELQAIGRVHRIGQTRPTYVYGYMVRDTVEERIVALAAERKQSLYVCAHSHRERGDTTTTHDEHDHDGVDENRNDSDRMDAEAEDSALLQAAHDAAARNTTQEIRRGDLVGSTNDLLACLFPQHLGSAPTPPSMSESE